MSTKSTLACVGDWHLYWEGLDEDAVCLSVENLPHLGELTLRIPLAVWLKLRRPAVVNEKEIRDLATLDDEALAQRAREEVAERLRKWREAPTKAAKAVIATRGCFILGSIEAPVGRQVEDLQQHLLEKRTWARGLVTALDDKKGVRVEED